MSSANRWLFTGIALLVLVDARGTVGHSSTAASQANISEDLYVQIGGIDQWLTIRGENRKNPVALVLHGGPGAAFSPFDDSTFSSWRKTFTVVQWDQRGAGRTYTKNGPSIESTMTMDRMVADGIEVARYLIQHLHQRKIVIFGGSWGSILGVYMARQRPDLFYAYVGTAQIVDARQSELAKTYEHLLAMARAADDQKAINELRTLGPPPWDSLDQLFAFFRWTGTYEAKTSTPLNMPVSQQYASERERTEWAAAMTMSVTHFFGPKLDGPLMHLDLPALGTDFAIPVFLIQGQEDLKAPPDLARAYFDRITAPQKRFFLSPQTGHEPTRISMHIILEVLNQRVRPICQRQVQEIHS